MEAAGTVPAMRSNRKDCKNVDTYRPLCFSCGKKHRRLGSSVHYLPPYLHRRRNRVACFECGYVKEHDMNLDVGMPRRGVRVVCD